VGHEFRLVAPSERCDQRFVLSYQASVVETLRNCRIGDDRPLARGRLKLQKDALETELVEGLS
jgi:hypothetical protein